MRPVVVPCIGVATGALGVCAVVWVLATWLAATSQKAAANKKVRAKVLDWRLVMGVRGMDGFLGRAPGSRFDIDPTGCPTHLTPRWPQRVARARRRENGCAGFSRRPGSYL